MHAHRELDAVDARPQTPSPAAVGSPKPKAAPVSAECGSGWYHDVAIKEARQAPTRKH